MTEGTGSWGELPPKEKRCCACGEIKPASEFYTSKWIKDGLDSKCKPCSIDYATRWKLANPERFKERRREHLLRTKYNLTPEDYDNLLTEQNGTCAVCGDLPNGDPAGGVVLVIDHDHETNEVRGILCSRCNAGLGMFLDDTERLAVAIEYLQLYQGEE